MYHFTAFVTCLAILFYFFTSVRVARARAAHKIKPPAISGNLDFERVFRVQMNTLEWLPIFLPVAVRRLCQRSLCGAAWTGVDRRPHPLHDRL